ncbi:MupA/Atu3671 family FMN-dependent luciferase-like monooxygenase [Fodinicola acaciae]|uniref:MupA/Atu3671 family FMN-dependent luciferase-like monooxygenase n=1 Tax=Fodinicola acaciae TaxID=2681555 RepID=UPI0013D6019D|nr:MupA/Atu3671 family FMN-dependent luciferase-like monooxygenase [Fodinicola acaciae]
MRFSLLYFANRDAAGAAEQYDLLLESARIADRNGFEALWVPERHFHAFGGAYPNPAVAAAAVAAVTSRIRIRAGSVVLPLNDVLRVTEDWAVVDNISGGRVDLAFAAGWNANDFVLAPAAFARRRTLLPDMIAEFTGLWRGEHLSRVNGKGDQVEVTVFPRPVQRLPGIWLTASSSIRTFRRAGSSGANVLTAMLFMSLDELGTKIAAYRQAREDSGLDPYGGTVTLMLHTHVGPTTTHVRETVRPAFLEYLRSSTTLWGQEMRRVRAAADADPLTLLEFAFDRYFRRAALFGSVERCREFVGRLERTGVDEVACLIDFGLSRQETVNGLGPLSELVGDRRLAGTVDT